MAHKRRIRIDVELEEISAVLREAVGTNAELPIRLIYELKNNPDESLASIRERLGVPARSATRWLGILKQKGFPAYAGHTWRHRAVVQNSQPFRSQTKSSDENLSVPELMTLLMVAPSHPDEGVWCTEMKAWIRKLLPEVDRVGISIVNNVNLFDPDDGSYGIVRSDYARANPEGDLEVQDATIRESSPETHWMRIYLRARDSRLFVAGDYHPPTGADYYYQYDNKREFVGCLVLLRSAKNSPLRRETMATLHMLEPLIVRLMGEAVARFQVWRPHLASSDHALSGIDPDDVLTQREKEVAFLHLTGEGYRGIARIMNIDKKTVATHTSNILKKLGFENIKDMMASAHSSRGFRKHK